MNKILSIAAVAMLSACVANQPAGPTTAPGQQTYAQTIQTGLVDQTKTDLQNNLAATQNALITNAMAGAATGTAPAATTAIDPYVNKATQVINTYEAAKAVMAQ